MATPEQITEWKRQYGAIYSISVRGVEYIFRAVKFSEYDAAFAIASSGGSAEAEDLLVEMALLAPLGTNFELMPAGVVSVIAEEVLSASGMGDAQRSREVLNQKREKAMEFRGLMKAFVIATMPYKEEELDELTFPELAAKVALSEQIIKVNQAMAGIEGGEVRLDIIDPSEEVVDHSARAQKHAINNKPGQAGVDDPIADKLRQALG